MVGEAISNELFAPVTYLGLCWKHNLSGVQNGLVLENRLLGLIVAKRFCTKKKLVEDYPNAPNVDLVGYLWRVLLEALWSLVPICANSL
jgi:hypothetical protein